MADILILHGPNLNLLGEREVDIYGAGSLEDINNKAKEAGAKAQVEIETWQSNDEGELIDKIHAARNLVRVIILNPGALTHYSYALRDAIASIEIPVIEVHLSNIYAREKWRQKSVTAGAARGIITGFGEDSYILAIDAALRMIKGSP
jgi:3-dehydroquinate dehydratase-2